LISWILKIVQNSPSSKFNELKKCVDDFVNLLEHKNNEIRQLGVLAIDSLQNYIDEDTIRLAISKRKYSEKLFKMVNLLEHPSNHDKSVDRSFDINTNEIEQNLDKKGNIDKAYTADTLSTYGLENNKPTENDHSRNSKTTFSAG
ncbi:MAG: hypothetical protein MHPSP_004744, partial [Paramarteilia canceri]